MSLADKIKLILIILKGGRDMITVYVTLIIKGYKAFGQVPQILKEPVKNELEVLGLDENGKPLNNLDR